MSVETLYLVLERAARSWKGVRISKVSKHRPTLARPSEQALLKLQINIPDSVMEPRALQVQINPDHIIAPEVKVNSVPA